MAFKFRDGVTVESDDPGGDLLERRIDPFRLLADSSQAQEVAAALTLVRNFLDAAQKAGVLELY